MKRTNTDNLYKRRKELVPNGLGYFNDASVKSARGAIITDLDDNEIIDFAGGIGVLNTGHRPQVVVDAIKNQADKFIHSCFNVAIYEPYLDLAEKLILIIPHGEKTKVMLTNCGAESVENAIKVARQATKRSAIICYSGAFHGRTLMALTLTSSVKYKKGCGPFAPEVYRLDYPYYGPKEKLIFTEDEFVKLHVEKLYSFFSTYVNAQDVAGILIEIVQGEGGFNTAPPEYLHQLRKICDEFGIILIFDEVQSGFGRTGKWAAFQNYNITPDISTWAKSLGAGLPIGAVLAKQEIFDACPPSSVGGTYLGNPICCAAALANLKLMEEININELGRNVGSIVRTRFEKIQNRFPNNVYDIKGLGAMLAIEFVNPETGKPDTDLVKKISQKSLENGLLIISSGNYGQCIRILSPLNIENKILNKGLDILENSIAESI